MLSKEDTSIMDEQLAAGPDFFERLCLVRKSPLATGDAAAAAAPPGREVATYELWPALKFDAHRDLVDGIKTVRGLSNMASFRMLLAYNRIVRDAAPPPCHGVAYLIGLGSIALVPKSSAEGAVEIDDVHVFDFCRHCEEMLRGEGHCGTEQFRGACELSMHRMEVGMEAEPPEPALAREEGGRREKAVTLTTVGSARKTFTNMEVSPKKRQERTEKLVPEEVGSAPKSVSKRSRITDSAGKMYSDLSFSPLREKRGKRKQVQSAVGQGLLSPEKRSMREDESMTSADLPVKTVEFSGDASGSFSSPEKSSVGKSDDFGDESQAGCFSRADGDDGKEEGSKEAAVSKATRKSNRKPPSSSRDVPWIEMWQQMQSEGWRHINGTGLVAWYYLHPTCAGMSKSDILSDKKEGEDYFTSEEDVKTYARINLGWRTEDRELCASSPKDAELADRVKKRKRTCQKPAVAVKAETKKTEAKKTKMEKMEAKKGPSKKGNKPKPQPKSKSKQQVQKPKAKAKVEPVKPAPRKEPGSPESCESEESRFSDFSGSGSSGNITSGSSENECSVSSENSSGISASQSRSTIDSPTISECEADLGVKKSAAAARKKKANSSVKLKFSQSSQDLETSSCSVTSGSSRRSCRSGSIGDSESLSEQSSLDDTYQVLASRDAWLLLRDRFGFCQHGVYHCLPGKENRPGKDSKAVEGTHYFSSLSALRNHLCGYGLPEIKPNKELTEEEKGDLSRWVRYAHVINIRDAEIINRDEMGEPLQFKNAWTMLTKLGMKWTSSYVYPNSDPTKAPLKFDRLEDLVAHIARFGIPRFQGIEPHEVLTREERLMLDLFIADEALVNLVDTFKRRPVSDAVNEITPRRTRRRCTDSGFVSEPKVNTGRSKQALSQQAYRAEFDSLEIQRSLPARLVSSKEALSTLVDSYNFSVVQRDGHEYYCLPTVALMEGEDSVLGVHYFETVQDMRENLCAFGLPPIAKGAKLSDGAITGLESWVRCAHMVVVRDDGEGGPPEVVRPKLKQVKTWLKQLGYTFRDNFHMVLLPGARCVGSKPGVDRFDSIIDLFNHVARFGLDTDKAESEVTVSEENQLTLEVFVASVATFDVSKRIKCNAPIVKRSPIVKQGSAVAEKHAAMTLVPNAMAKPDSAVCTPRPSPAMVIDEGDQETPQPSPPKKPRTNTITNFFTTTGNVTKKALEAVVEVFSPSKKSSPCRDAKSNSPMLSSVDLSASCLDKKGDNEVEACFAEPQEHDASTSSPHIDDKGCDGVGACSGLPKREISNVLGSAMQNDETAGTCTANSLEQEEMPKALGGTPQHTEKEFSTPKNVSAGLLKSPNMPWKDLWSEMRKIGWTTRRGTGLVAWFWVHPNTGRLKTPQMLSQCTEGIHYFTTERDIQRYAMDNLGWAGEGAAPSPASDISLTSRVKKRKQIAAAAKPDDEPSPQKRRPESSMEYTEVGSRTKIRLSPRTKSPPLRCEENEKKESLATGNKPRGVEKHDPTSAKPQSNCKRDNKALPDKEITIGEKLEACQMVLHPSYKKHKLNKSSSSSVVLSMEDEIKDFMMKSIETGMVLDGMTLPSPGFLYICGSAGTGKSTAVAWCGDEMKKWAKHNEYDKPHICTINMATAPTLSRCKGGIMRAMLAKISKELKIDKEADLRTFEAKFKKEVLVLVLDEIDMLFKNHEGKGEDWFKELVRWAEDKELKFSMIGISNCVNDDSANRVRDFGHSPRELVFSPYKEADILAILEQRLGKNVVDLKALQLISRRIAASSGDVRRALEITSKAVGNCSSLLSEEKLKMAVEDGENKECILPLVKLPHMMRAIREGMPTSHIEIIVGLPQAAKVILCIAVSLSQVWGPTAEISISQLKKYCAEATHHIFMDELGVGQISNLVQMLVDSGLLITGNSGHFSPQDVNIKLKIGVQLDDVEIALEKSLLNEGGFYRRLVDYVKRECPHPPTGQRPPTY